MNESPSNHKCPLCEQIGYEPNEETTKALKEAEESDLTSVETVEELFKKLEEEDGS